MLNPDHRRNFDAAMGPLIVDLPGCELTEEDRDLLKHPAVGGVILFGRNIESPRQLRNLNLQIRDLRPSLLLCVDQEGGRVQRCKQGFTPLPPMQKLGDYFQDQPQQGLSLARECGWLLAKEMLAVGFDFSFAPVLDVDRDFSSVIGDRSFAADSDVVTVLAEQLISGIHQAGSFAVGKHFPGHGGVQADSHLELPRDSRTLAEIEEKDLIPFRRLSKQLDAVMPAHIVFHKEDSEPVGFSEYWLGQVLRKSLGYNGLIISDDLSMAGAKIIESPQLRVERSLAAGCDLVLLCNDRPAVIDVVQGLDEGWYYRNHSSRDRMLACSSAFTGMQELKEQARWQRASAALSELTD